ncbi:hypothetical protein BGX33_006122 [Mortierella sp. NVP41]|nr:hypothetical protein BGX33_006122 [Mortierella sp. NVP41]
MQLDHTTTPTAFAQPGQRPRRSTISTTTRSTGAWREQRQRINSDVDADQEDERPLPLHATPSSSNQTRSHRSRESGGTSDRWSLNQHSGQPTDNSQDITPISTPAYRATGIANRRSSQRPPPPRLPGHSRSQSEANLGSLSPVPIPAVPSPLASPITATANSLTALTISSSGPYGVSGRDLSKITVPRGRRSTRPYSVCSTESLLTQDRMRNGFGETHHTTQASQLSDSEVPSTHEHGTRGQSSKSKRSSVHPPHPSPSLPIACHSTAAKKSTGLKSPAVKPAAQLRVTLYNLVSAGILPAETLVVFREHSAIITAKGTLIPQMKEPDAMAIYPWLQCEYETPSAWATAMVKGGRTGKVAVNGWSAIKIPIQQDLELAKTYEAQGVAEVSLDAFRKKYLAEIVEDGASPAGGESIAERGGKDSTLLDRKKRKRPSARSAEAAGLRVTTTVGTRGSKGRAEPTRPRKRTVSDLSGMVSSDLLQDRQLRWEAAGALFSMQDGLMSPTDDLERRPGPYQHRLHRNRGIIPLESLERRRQEQEVRRGQSSKPRVSALQTLRPLSLVPVAVPLSLMTSLAHMEFCVLCGGTGSIAGSHRRPSGSSNVSHQWSSAESMEPGLDNDKFEQDAMRRCFDCGECYHLDCLPSDPSGDRDSSSVLDESWRCPRCTICQLCQKSIHEHPSSSTPVGTASQDAPSLTEIDGIKALTCDKCRKFAHLQCQVVIEPALKPALRSPANRHTQEWMCLSCRECVECGHRVNRGSGSGRAAGEDSATDSDAQELVTTEGRWSYGSALCPSCTVLAEKGNICPLCCTIYQDDDYETPMIFCDGCSLWVHVACDKGLQDRDYEELGEDSKQYFCPSCIPTPIPSPAPSSSSSIFSTAHSIDENPWNGPCRHGVHGGENCHDCNSEDDWYNRSSRKKDDILDLLKAAKEISDSESRATSPYSAYSAVFSSTHPRTMSASLESVAEVAAAEALLTIFSGASTPVSSTPYTSYPPSPFEPSINGLYDRHYSVNDSPHDHPPHVGSMAFTPSSGLESIGSSRDRYSFSQEDYFNSRPYSRPSIPYHHIGQELELTSAQSKEPLRKDLIMEPGDVIMAEDRAGLQSPRASEERDAQAPMMSSTKHGTHSDLYRPLASPHHSFQRNSSSDAVPSMGSLPEIVDTRTCLLCHRGSCTGNDSSKGELLALGRLLPLTLQSSDIALQGSTSSAQAGWVHSNCALWSTGVTLEATRGGMENVSRIVSQSLHTSCSSCGRPGASIKCKASASKANDNPYACTAAFHYPCMSRLDQPHHHGLATNTAVVMDQRQRTILCSMHYREVSTLNDLRSAAFALQSSVSTTGNSAQSSHLSSQVPPVTLRTTWQGPFWIKDSLMVLDDASGRRTTTDAIAQESSLDSFRVGGLTIHTLGRFDSPELAHSETGLANDVDLEAYYETDAGKPSAKLQSRDRVFALPLGFKCSRRVLLGGYHPCTATAEVVHRRSLPEGSVESLRSHDAVLSTQPGSVELDTIWRITLAFSGGNSVGSLHDREFYAHSMQDAVDQIFSTFGNDQGADRQSSRQYGLYLQSPDAFFGLNHPLIRQSIRSIKGEKEVASRVWTRYREVQRALERQCRRNGYTHQSSQQQRKDRPEHSKGSLEFATAARVRSRPGSLLSRRRVTRIGIARSSDFSSTDSTVQKDGDARNGPLVPGLLQELIRVSTATTAATAIAIDHNAPPGSDKAPLNDLSQPCNQEQPPRDPFEKRVLPALEMTPEQLQSLRADQLKNVALVWNGRRMAPSQFAAFPPTTQLSQGLTSVSPSVTSVDHDKEISVRTPEDMDVDSNTRLQLHLDRSQSKSSSTTLSGSTIKLHADVRVYATRTFTPDEVIMEYTGEVIHPSIAIRRQELYQRQGRSCYMMWCEFQDAVVDATVQGGLARYIRDEDRHPRQRDNLQQQRSVYARTVTGPGIHGPKVVICAAGALEVGDELIIRYC